MRAHLRFEGDDTTVGGVAAYSTLGHFKDPVLNTMLVWNDVQLAARYFTSWRIKWSTSPANPSSTNRSPQSSRRRVSNVGSRRAARVQEMRGWYAQREAAANSSAVARDARALAEALRLEAARRGDARSASSGIRSAQVRVHRSCKAKWNGYAGYDRWFDSHAQQCSSGLGSDVSRLPARFERAAEVGRRLPRFYAARARSCSGTGARATCAVARERCC